MLTDILSYSYLFIIFPFPAWKGIAQFTGTVRTTRPENCEFFAQSYQSQPITTKFKNTANIFLTFGNHV